jgi:hypothetical protein
MVLPAAIAKGGAKLTIFGQVTDRSGKAVTDFESPAEVLESKGDLFLQRTLLDVDSGSALKFGVAAGNTIVGVGDATLDGADSETSKSLSRLIVSNNVYNLSQPQNPFDPFTFGGTRVIPKVDRTFHPGDEVWLFAELRNPALAEGESPKLSMQVTIDGNGRQVVGSWQPAEASPLKGVKGHFGIGTTVDLSSLKAGDYKIKLALRDAAARQVIEREQAITVKD